MNEEEKSISTNHNQNNGSISDNFPSTNPPENKLEETDHKDCEELELQTPHENNKDDCNDHNNNLSDIDELLEEIGIPGEQKSKFKSIVRAYSYKGPLPHPGLLKGYEEILPGAAHRIITMTENQQNHRISSTQKLIDADIHQSKSGLKFAFILALLLLLGGIILIGFGKDLSGYVLIIPTMTGLVSLFIKETFLNKDKENASDDEEN